MPDQPEKTRSVARARQRIPAIWASRGMIEALTQRVVRTRYKHSLLGPLWVFVSPLAYLLLFTTLFRRIALVNTEGVPYALFVLTAIVPWQFFAAGVGSGSSSIISNLPLIRKFRVPSEVYPISAIGVALADMLIISALLPIFFVAFGRVPGLTVLWIPLLIMIEVIVIAAPVMLLSALMPWARDLQQAIPLALQIGVLSTPIAYSIDILSPTGQIAMSILNPAAPVIDGIRRVLVYDKTPQFDLIGIGLLSAVILLTIGWYVFRRLERGFADVA
jgi:ABC-type polysaccharide/polyol phosphate export permease